MGTYAYGFQGSGKGRERDAAPDESEQRAVGRIGELRAASASYESSRQRSPEEDYMRLWQVMASDDRAKNSPAYRVSRAGSPG